jgi:hypothetical protein
MTDDGEFDSILQWLFAQVRAYEKREQSRAEKFYGSVMLQSAAALASFTRTASFDNLIRVEKAFQQNDLVVYAKRLGTMKSVQEGIDDFEAGEEVYRQLLEDTRAYKAHRYRRKNSTDNAIPLDTMRQALRGQVRRVENYRSNVMGNSAEQEFLSERIAMLRQAEKLYDAIQRERLSLPGTDV